MEDSSGHGTVSTGDENRASRRPHLWTAVQKRQHRDPRGWRLALITACACAVATVCTVLIGGRGGKASELLFYIASDVPHQSSLVRSSISGGGSAYPTYSVFGGESVQRNAMLGSGQFWEPPSRLRRGVQSVQGNIVFRSGGPHYASFSPLVPQRQLRLVGSFLDGGTIVQGLAPKLVTSPGSLLQAPVVSTPGFIRLAHMDGNPQYTEVPQEVSPSVEQAPQSLGAPQYVEVRQEGNPTMSREEPHYMEERQIAPRYMDMPYYTEVRRAASPYVAETPQYAEMQQAAPRYVEVSRYREVRKATPLIYEQVRRAKDPHGAPVLLRNYGGLAREQSPIVYRESGSPLLQRVPIAVQGQIPVVTVTYHEPAQPPPPANDQHKIKKREEREEERAVKDERRKSERQYKEMYKKIQGIARHIEEEESEHAIVDQQSYRRPLQRAKALMDRVESMRTQPVPDLEAPNIHTQSPISPPTPASTIPSEEAEEPKEGKILPSPPSPFMEQPYEQPEPQQSEYKSVQASKLPEIDFTKRFPDPVPGKRLTGTWRYSEHGQDLPADPEYLVSAHAY